MNYYKEQIEKQAGAIGNAVKEGIKGFNRLPLGKKILRGANIGQKALGIGLGTAAGGTIGYSLARDNNNNSKLNSLKETKKQLDNKNINTNNINREINEYLMYKSPFLSDDNVEFESSWMDGLSQDINEHAKRKNLDINSMKINDFHRLVDDYAIPNYAGAKIDLDDNKKSRSQGLELMKHDDWMDDDFYNKFNIYKDKIEKKAFFSEGLIAGIGAGVLGNGIGRGVNFAESHLTPKGRQIRKELEELQNDKRLVDADKLRSSNYKFVRDKGNSILETNPDMTVGEFKKQIIDSYKNDFLGKQANQRYNNLEKQAANMSKLEAYKKLITGRALKDANKAIKKGNEMLNASNGQLQRASNAYYKSKNSYNIAKKGIPYMHFADDFIKSDYNRMLANARYSNKVQGKINDLQKVRNNIARDTKVARGLTGAGVIGLGTVGAKTIKNRGVNK